jgi:hypothetical protein
MPEPGSTEELKAAALTAECEVEASFAQLAHVVNPGDRNRNLRQYPPLREDPSNQRHS